MKASRWTVAGALAAALALTSAPALAANTANPGQQGDRVDADDNGYSDAGVYVTGHYTSLYAEDGNGDYYWDLGDGRVYTSPSIDSIDDLDQSTLTVCDYQNVYRADFNNDPYMDTGWITNNISCSGAEPGTYKYLIVHEDDPRYTGNPDMAVWGTWEYHVLTQSGMGNVANPMHPDHPG